MTFPMHPLSSMQAPFEESMLEATGDAARGPFTIPNKTLEARQQLLCREPEATELAWNFTYNCHWRYRSRGKFHPLLKTASQIIFGVHLLHQHLEKSVADVADILLKHVNELDGFLKRANEDLDGSTKDMLFRRKCLRVPMEHVNEFDRLLDDRAYRAQLLDGNVVIERTINRMSQVLNDYLVDMTVFRDANQELQHYLMAIGHEWTAMNDDVGRIYSAMCGNTGGWAHFLQSLVAKAERLGVVLVQVSSYCNEIEKRCGAASRRSLIASRSSSRNSSNSREAARSFRNFANNKPLPTVPNERPPFIPTPSSKSLDSSPGPISHIRHTSSPLASNSALHGPDSDSEDAVSPRQQIVYPVSQSHEPFELAAAPARINRSANVDQTQNVSWINAASPEKRGRDDSAIMLRQDVYKPDGCIGFSDEKEVIARHDLEEKEALTIRPIDQSKGESSPPLTGKDSAYSSISGGSVISPGHPRSQSAQSSYPRAQFGLFPSSQPSTPKHSISGRYGGVPSPGIHSPMIAPDHAPQFIPQRSYTSLDTHSSSSRRLLRKSSLSSLKRLFSRDKKGSGVDTIAE
ncbi:unnamed protein product [Periconia digitata]|uniref:Uncharacterized protein n=1 Tax=Periconia digitata TaxID=1303443 RepID=A0A9W4URJ9_9PLEO|nr:unnamed protein product [Periconia digitata]